MQGGEGARLSLLATLYLELLFLPRLAPASASASIERKNEAAGFSASGAEGCSPRLPLLAALLRNYTSSLHRRDGVTTAFSAHNNNNSTLPTKLLELSSEDFLPPSTP